MSARLDAVQGDLLADLAIEDVEVNADDRWLVAAREVVTGLVRAGRDFTTDDVWAELDRLEVPSPREPRALGAVMRWASRQLDVDKAPLPYVKSTRPENHARPIPVWRPNT